MTIVWPGGHWWVSLNIGRVAMLASVQPPVPPSVRFGGSDCKSDPHWAGFCGPHRSANAGVAKRKTATLAATRIRSRDMTDISSSSSGYLKQPAGSHPGLPTHGSGCPDRGTATSAVSQRTPACTPMHSPSAPQVGFGLDTATRNAPVFQSYQPGSLMPSPAGLL